jgi:hypothetical protein
VTSYIAYALSVVAVSTTELESYLASEEELLLSFSAESVEGEDAGTDFASDSDYMFGATDRRIVYVTGSGGFKDIEFSHISSIESDTETEEDRQEALAICTGCCGGVAVVSGIITLFDEPSSALAGLLSGSGLLAVAYYAYQNADGETTEKQKVKFITGDEADQQIEATVSPDVSGNIGAELSSILREQR